MKPDLLNTTPSALIDWLMDNVVVCPSGCWVWTGADSGEDGRGANYPKVKLPRSRKNVYVHRVVHQVCIGPIPVNHQVDHKCKHWSFGPAIAHRRCVNPDHLEAVYQTENIKRNGRR